MQTFGKQDLKEVRNKLMHIAQTALNN